MPTWEIEDKIGGAVCGVDEAGRGPWVGPVVAGAVMFMSRDVNPEILAHIDDSKKLTAKKPIKNPVQLTQFAFIPILLNFSPHTLKKL